MHCSSAALSNAVYSVLCLIKKRL